MHESLTKRDRRGQRNKTKAIKLAPTSAGETPNNLSRNVSTPPNGQDVGMARKGGGKRCVQPLCAATCTRNMHAGPAHLPRGIVEAWISGGTRLELSEIHTSSTFHDLTESRNQTLRRGHSANPGSAAAGFVAKPGLAELPLANSGFAEPPLADQQAADRSSAKPPSTDPGCRGGLCH